MTQNNHYQEAQCRIEQAIESGSGSLNFRDLADLDVLPPEISELPELTGLHLRDTKVSDLSPLAGLTKLTWLLLEDTEVSDLSPLALMTALARLDLNGTNVTDLSPLAGLTALNRLYLEDTQVADPRPLIAIRESLVFLSLKHTPAYKANPALRNAHQIVDHDQRTAAIFAAIEAM